MSKKYMEEFMKKRIGILVLTLGLMLSGIDVQASGKNSTFNFSQYFNLLLDEVKGVQNEDSLSSLKDSIDELIKNVKPEEAKKILQFVEKYDNKQGFLC